MNPVISDPYMSGRGKTALYASTIHTRGIMELTRFETYCILNLADVRIENNFSGSVTQPVLDY
jgi:hypothetical protein